MSEFKVDAETQRKLAVFQFDKCTIFDYDFKLLLDENNGQMFTEIKRVITSYCIPCVFERTTNGWHVIVLDESTLFIEPLMAIKGFDHTYWDIGRNRLRSRKKSTERFNNSFIKERHYFYLEYANNSSLIEYINYSDKILMNAHKTFWDDEDWDENDPF
jgi:hypothetical protein